MNMKNEPAVIIGAIVAFLIVVVNALVAFYSGFTADQVAAILSVINGAGALAGAFFIRQNVYSPDSVKKIKDENYLAGLPPTDPPPPMPPPGA